MLISSKDYWAFSRLFLPSICLRTSRLSSSFLKPVFVTPYYISLSPLSLFSFSNLNVPSPPLSIVTLAEPLIQNFQNLLFTPSLKILLYQLPPSASAPPHFSSPLALEFPTISLGTPVYSTPPSVTRRVATSHKSPIAYPSRINMDSGWVAINLQTNLYG